MDNQNPQEQAVAVEIATEATEPPINLIAKMKAAFAEMSARQILKLVLLGLALIAWYPVYSRLNPFSQWVAYDLFGIAHGSHLGESVAFFLLDIPKVFMLLLLIVWAVGVIRSFFTPERTRALLAGKREFLGHGLAGALGVVTPFCSCSAVPLFIGFMEAGIPLGVTFSFLITAPMVNEIALALLLGHVRLAHRPALHGHGTPHCHLQRPDHRSPGNGAPGGRLGLRDPHGEASGPSCKP